MKPAGPSAARSAPEAIAPTAFAALQARARTAFAPARSAGVNDESVKAFIVALAPNMRRWRTASAATAIVRSPANAAASANGREASSTATIERTAPSRDATKRPWSSAPRLPASARTPSTRPSAPNGTAKRSAKKRLMNGRKLPAPNPKTVSMTRNRRMSALRRGASSVAGVTGTSRIRIVGTMESAAMTPPPATSARSTSGSPGAAPSARAAGAASAPASTLERNAAVVPRAICCPNRVERRDISVASARSAAPDEVAMMPPKPTSAAATTRSGKRESATIATRPRPASVPPVRIAVRRECPRVSVAAGIAPATTPTACAPTRMPMPSSPKPSAR